MIGEKQKIIIVLCIITAAIVLINIGIMNGDVSAVENKSTKICLECIGIG